MKNIKKVKKNVKINWFLFCEIKIIISVLYIPDEEHSDHENDGPDEIIDDSDISDDDEENDYGEDEPPNFELNSDSESKWSKITQKLWRK